MARNAKNTRQGGRIKREAARSKQGGNRRSQSNKKGTVEGESEQE